MTTTDSRHSALFFAAMAVVLWALFALAYSHTSGASWHRTEAMVARPVFLAPGGAFAELAVGDGPLQVMPADLSWRPGQMVPVWSNGSSMSFTEPEVPFAGLAGFGGAACVCSAIAVAVIVRPRLSRGRGASSGVVRFLPGDFPGVSSGRLSGAAVYGMAARRSGTCNEPAAPFNDGVAVYGGALPFYDWDRERSVDRTAHFYDWSSEV